MLCRWYVISHKLVFVNIVQKIYLFKVILIYWQLEMNEISNNYTQNHCHILFNNLQFTFHQKVMWCLDVRTLNIEIVNVLWSWTKNYFLMVFLSWGIELRACSLLQGLIYFLLLLSSSFPRLDFLQPNYRVSQEVSENFLLQKFYLIFIFATNCRVIDRSLDWVWCLWGKNEF